MAIRVVRLGTVRAPDEGVRLGTVRRPPRGVKKSDFARQNYYDVWLPALSPSAKTVTAAMASDWTDARWKKFRATYLKEMKEPAARQLIELLAALSARTNLSVGCYCEDERRCHRSILRELLADAGATIAD
jgi:uncharacterized protein YeaO (DUF488 family)